MALQLGVEFFAVVNLGIPIREDIVVAGDLRAFLHSGGNSAIQLCISAVGQVLQRAVNISDLLECRCLAPSPPDWA